MNPNSDEIFSICATALTKDSAHRVWSFIVTIFGDLALSPNARISGSVLSQITEHVGIRPDAMRVALHRLRKDGWIDSQRSGRASIHFLTDLGRQQSSAAYPRIYADKITKPNSWHILIANPSDKTGGRFPENLLSDQSYLRFGTNTILGQGSAPTCYKGLVAMEVNGLQIPGWLKRQICPQDLSDAYKLLHEALAKVDAVLLDNPQLSVVQVAALRALIVHSWRRVLLRHHDLPAYFFPPNWTGPACRDLVNRLLTRLPRPAPENLCNLNSR